ncbi:hypothetical protein KGY79_11760 [Candidatus Bipolaricaulota bacterium]|nr:hypothetical protein [Candidatus Bipolaricaulota bacterium]
MFTEQSRCIRKFGLLLVVLISLSIFLAGCVDVSEFFTAGCVDINVVMKIEDNENRGDYMLTISTDSEEVFEGIKSSFAEDSDDEEEEQDQVQTSINEKEGVYSVMIQDELSDEDFHIETESSRVVYTFEDIVFDLGEVIVEEKRDEIIASCEGYYYSFSVDLPNKIQGAWWINLENEKIEEVAVDNINDQTFSFEIPMATVMSKTKTEDWANRSGVIIQTEK